LSESQTPVAPGQAYLSGQRNRRSVVAGKVTRARRILGMPAARAEPGSGLRIERRDHRPYPSKISRPASGLSTSGAPLRKVTYIWCRRAWALWLLRPTRADVVVFVCFSPGGDNTNHTTGQSAFADGRNSVLPQSRQIPRLRGVAIPGDTARMCCSSHLSRFNEDPSGHARVCSTGPGNAALFAGARPMLQRMSRLRSAGHANGRKDAGHPQDSGPCRPNLFPVSLPEPGGRSPDLPRETDRDAQDCSAWLLKRDPAPPRDGRPTGRARKCGPSHAPRWLAHRLSPAKNLRTCLNERAAYMIRGPNRLHIFFSRRRQNGKKRPRDGRCRSTPDARGPAADAAGRYSPLCMTWDQHWGSTSRPQSHSDARPRARPGWRCHGRVPQTSPGPAPIPRSYNSACRACPKMPSCFSAKLTARTLAVFLPPHRP